mmetsp:Transcript_26977/g.62132  ORF Transcript_26977/g.62132 Transcript_26977/m.62132 type:complete len:315 (+) Transcript_26977:1315-2259(+)
MVHLLHVGVPLQIRLGHRCENVLARLRGPPDSCDGRVGEPANGQAGHCVGGAKVLQGAQDGAGALGGEHVVRVEVVELVNKLVDVMVGVLLLEMIPEQGTEQEGGTVRERVLRHVCHRGNVLGHKPRHVGLARIPQKRHHRLLAQLEVQLGLQEHGQHLPVCTVGAHGGSSSQHRLHLSQGELVPLVHSLGRCHERHHSARVHDFDQLAHGELAVCQQLVAFSKHGFGVDAHSVLAHAQLILGKRLPEPARHDRVTTTKGQFEILHELCRLFVGILRLLAALAVYLAETSALDLGATRGLSLTRAGRFHLRLIC